MTDLGAMRNMMILIGARNGKTLLVGVQKRDFALYCSDPKYIPLVLKNIARFKLFGVSRA